MEMLICVIGLLFFSGVIYSLGASNGKDEQKSFEEIEEKKNERNLIKKEISKLYKNMTKKQIENELKNIADDYKKLVKLARDKYENENNGQEPLTVDLHNNIIDMSEDYRYSINYTLAIKYDILNQILADELYVMDLEPSEYTVFSYLYCLNKNGETVKTKYSAKVKFDVDDGARIGFIYSDTIKKKNKNIGKIAVLLYDYIDKVESTENEIVLSIKHAKTMEKYVKNSLSVDYKIENDIIRLKLETESPKEIEKNIKKKLKK